MAPSSTTTALSVASAAIPSVDPTVLTERLESARKRLSNLTDLILPTDYPRPIPATTVEAELKRSLSDKSSLAILQLLASASSPTGSASSTSSSASPFDVLLAAFSVLLHKYTGEDDICVGSSSSSTNPLVLRLNVTDEAPFSKVVAGVLSAVQEAAENEVPFATLLDFLFPPTPESEEHITPSLFKVRFFDMTDTTPATLSATTTSSSCDITILISQAATLRRILPIDVTVLYNTVLFAESRITDMLDQLEAVLVAAAAEPAIPIGLISTVTQSSRSRLPDVSADLHWDGFEGAITDIFARNAAAHPERVCVVENAPDTGVPRTFTYQQIHEASNVLAHHLIRNGIQREDVVVLYSYRGVDLVVAVMGVLKSGATFSVIDPAYPPARQVVYLSVAQPRGLVVLKKAGEINDEVRKYIREELTIACEVPALEILENGTLHGGLLAARDVLEPEQSLSGKNTGIVLGPDSIGTLSFTSGSTGIPKGVRGRHFSLTHFYPWMKEEFGMTELERFTMLSGIAHDPIQRDIFTPLFLGAQLHIPTAEDIGTPGRLAEWMAEHAVTVTHLTPAMGQLLSANAKTPIPSLRNAFFVGDVLTKRDVSRLQFLASNVHIVNMYGTTETQRAVSYLRIPPRSINPTFLVEQKDIMPAGKGMKDVQLIVISPKGLLCGVGEVGEIYVRSSGLAEGYLRLEDVTASKFILNNLAVAPAVEAGMKTAAEIPFYQGPRDRMYRSGDLGRYRPDGSVECTGRADDQVKIRGFRIELGEIDTHLSQHPDVRENVTLVRRDKFEEPTLVSYFVPLDAAGGNMPALIKDIREYLKQKLPLYAVPSVFAPLTRMPLTPNGKVDKNALPFPDTAVALNTAPTNSNTKFTPIQQSIRDVWSECLGIPPTSIDVDSNFFDLGGHSILATRLVFSLRKALAVELPLGSLYKDPTVGGLAAEVGRITGADLPVVTGATPSGTTGSSISSEQPPRGLRPSHSTEDLGGDEFNYASELDVLDDPNTISAALPGLNLDESKFTNPSIILLTGATGFLGAFILASLLDRFPACRVLCLVRAKDNEAGLNRLRDNGKRHLVWKEHWSERVLVVCGDLGKERLGLSEENWEKLAETVDVIVHNGALVHWVYPYSKLSAPNVHGTLWALKLACTRRLKPLHFVSSTSVLDTRSYIRKYLDAGKGVPESDDLEGARRGLRSGYGQTKWVAERLVMRARSRGVPATIIRPGYIVGHSKSGVGNTDDFLWRMVKGCIQLGKVPRISNIVNMCTVDYVAGATVEILASGGIKRECAVFHIWNQHHFRFDDLFSFLPVNGYAVTPTDYIQWRTALMDLTLNPATPADDQHALYPLLHFVLDDLPTSTRSPELDDAQTRDVVSGTNVICPDMRAVMPLFLSYFIETGFLERPQSSGNLPKLAEWEHIRGLLVSRSGN
ncbi:hypothetical protein DFJ73DRAFT_811755 [Zopfochytrium polystomum]|nr:hypothetical protein DFJ73DRAFT_811755 [Zopfochytrium polystomum]